MSLTDNEWAEFRRTSAEKGVTPTAHWSRILGHFGAVGGIVGFHDQYDNVEQGG